MKKKKKIRRTRRRITKKKVSKNVNEECKSLIKIFKRPKSKIE